MPSYQPHSFGFDIKSCEALRLVCTCVAFPFFFFVYSLRTVRRGTIKGFCEGFVKLQKKTCVRVCMVNGRLCCVGRFVRVSRAAVLTHTLRPTRLFVPVRYPVSSVQKGVDDDGGQDCYPTSVLDCGSP